MRQQVDGQIKEDFINGNIKIDMSNYLKPEGMSEDDWKREIQGQAYKSILLWAKLKFDRI